MTTFTVGKSSPNKSDQKNASLAMKSRQQVINEVNKRRTLLQDNSWIKKKPEEENTDENYGRVVLNQYKSQDGLHRSADENDDQKTLLSRYRSDTTLDRISGSSDADKANTLPALDSRPSKSKELDISVKTGNVTSPVKKKRQSWMPPPVSNQKTTTDNVEQHKRHSWNPPNTAAAVTINNKPVPTTSDKAGGPKMTIYSSEIITSPKPNAVVNDQPRIRQICPMKPSASDANISRTVTAERTGRSQDLDNLVEVRAIGDKSDQGSQKLDNLIKVKATSDKPDKGHQDLDDLIKVNRTSNGQDKGSEDLDDLIEIKTSTIDQNKKRSQELDDLIEIQSSTMDQNKKRSQGLDDLIEIKTSTMDQNKKRSPDLDDLIVMQSTAMDQNKKWAPEQGSESANIPGNQSDTNNSYQVTRGSSYNSSSSHSSPKDTIVYTRTYENSRFPHDAYEDNISRKSIKTVYSTSDRAVIEKEMCTYCRKPLGTDTKMILDALQICCHATCFKCEVCKAALENLKAGDSIWLYKNTVHCTPCYSEVKASWVY
ncbi:sciellin isoform X2 [Elgaria multicarinata webbii]|uniref:sciellin isoform X2 n=1 Tax=Elgaria multicarinata webbii TaxID=159646 RepID=UPI002FCCFF44